MIRPATWVFVVSWTECQDFLLKLGQRDGQKYRLPTEAEWEYACGAGSSSQYYTGNGAEALNRAGWYVGNSSQQTHPVGEKEPNQWGLFDMHGNVWQWCADCCDSHPEGDVTDPRGPNDEPNRALRGGSYYSGTDDCRTTSRCRFGRAVHGDGFGFRVVLTSAPKAP